MSKTEQNIIEGIKQLGRQPVTIIPGTVKSVDESAGTCTVSDPEGVDKFNVRIKAAIDEKETGLFVIPVVESSVLIARIDESNKWYILAYTDFEKIIQKNTKCEFKIEDKFTFKNDKTALKTILNDLLEELKTATMGPYVFTPDKIAKFELINNSVNQLLK